MEFLKQHQAFEAPARRVDNPGWASGRSSSLEVGARALPDDAAWILVVAIDQPLDPEVVGALLAAPEDGPNLPIHAGRPGHPVLLPGRLLTSLRTLSNWPEGLRSLVRSEVPTLVPVDTPAIHLDLNTPEQLLAASRAARQRP
jgi:CTP:molybdopterin cytidylyltransferase MocA